MFSMLMLFLFTKVHAQDAINPIDLHPRDSLNLKFNLKNVENCLIKARDLMHSRSDIYKDLQRFIEDKDMTYLDLRKLYPSSDSTSPIQRSVFAAFEGGWKGSWDGNRAEHIWFSTARNIQWVLISDDGLIQPAINYVDQDGTICGIVKTPKGERLHEGRYFEAIPGNNVAYLKWMIPNQNFYERASGKRYEIFQYLLGEKKNWAVEATYLSWKTRKPGNPQVSFKTSGGQSSSCGFPCEDAKAIAIENARRICKHWEAVRKSPFEIKTTKSWENSIYCTATAQFACE